MAKQSVSLTNDFCPQTLFLYGTKKADGTPNFGLFCWFSYYWDDELHAMCAIGGEKLTLDRIRETRVFSANLVTEALLPLADYLGNTSGREDGKMDFPLRVESGKALDVPVLADSPVAFELEVDRFLPMRDGEVLLCRIRNVLMDEGLLDAGVGVEQRVREIAPVRTTCQTYFGWAGGSLGPWGGPGRKFRTAPPVG